MRAVIGDEEKRLGRHDVGASGNITRADGLGWMEDVWSTFLAAGPSARGAYCS